MPALITHHLFGEKSAALLPEGIIRNQEDLHALLDHARERLRLP